MLLTESLTDIRAVCFDAGNVLTSMDMGRVCSLLHKRGFTTDLEDLRRAELLGRDAINEYLLSVEGQPVPDREYARHSMGKILTEVGIPVSELDSLIDYLRAESARHNLWECPLPGTREVLEELQHRGYPLGVISNSDGRCYNVLEVIGLADLFQFVIDSHVVGVEKPSRAIFELAIKRLGVPAESIAFIGDSYCVDYVGSARAGLRPLLLDPRGTCKFAKCNVIRNLSELLELLPGVSG